MPTTESSNMPAEHNVPPGEVDWVTIPAGPFVMGSRPDHDPDAEDDETPQRTLAVDAYDIARTPVTNAQYAAFVADAGHTPPVHWGGPRCPPGLEDHPVVYVGWHDAQAFAHWIGGRLPGEQEWEKAARGVDARLYPWGAEAPTDQRCNFARHVGGTTPVHRFAEHGASPWGVLDAAGNIWEWVADVYGDYNDPAPDDDPAAQRVMRGGSFYSPPEALRCANRSANDPDTRDEHIGFRVVRTPGAPASLPVTDPQDDQGQALYLTFIGPRVGVADLQNLAFLLGIAWEDLAGDTRPAKARALVTYARQRGWLARLSEALQKARPDLA